MNTLAIIDIETTGLNHRKAEIIDICVIIVNRDTLAVIKMYHSKIKPEHIDTAEPRALEVNGYTEEAWKHAPSLRHVIEELDTFVTGSALVAYNITFDHSFLEWAYRKVQRPYPFTYQRYCILSLAAFSIPGKNSYSLKSVCGYLGVPPEPEIHSAKNGAVTALAVLKALTKRS